MEQSISAAPKFLRLVDRFPDGHGVHAGLQPEQPQAHFLQAGECCNKANVVPSFNVRIVKGFVVDPRSSYFFFKPVRVRER